MSLASEVTQLYLKTVDPLSRDVVPILVPGTLSVRKLRYEFLCRSASRKTDLLPEIFVLLLQLMVRLL
jgi:hypothetical protein